MADRHRSSTTTSASAIWLLVVVVTLGAVISPAAPAHGAPSDDVDRLAGACVNLVDDARIGGGSGPFFVKPAGLGRFLFYGRDRRLLTAAPRGNPVLRGGQPTAAAIWSLRRSAGSTYLLAPTTPSGPAHTVDIRRTNGCQSFPEPEIDVTGPTFTGTDDGRLRGFVDSHAHLLAEQFLGGELHCGAPFSPLGVMVALRDCPDHEPEGIPAVSEQVLSRPGPHATSGWPSFPDWPRWDSLTHEQTYYRWIERSWRSGLRMVQNYYVQNRVLCERYWIGDQPCDEMTSVRVQHRMLHELIDYIDAQNGGPGRGFLRIATTAAQARQIIAAGKVAVTLGIEISEPFGCREIRGHPQCSTADIDRGLDELSAMGVRQVILTHKFDNALGGTRFDQGATGAAVNAGELLSTGHPWQVQTCDGEEKDNPVVGYPTSQRCNTRGLSALGAHAINGLINRHMAIDIDHFSVKSAEGALGIIESRHYPGVVSSHTWTDRRNYRRILAAGGIVGLFATPAEADPGESGRHGDMPPDFLSAWRYLRAQRDQRYPFGVGFGPDMGGLGKQAHPRPSARTHPVRYPFTGADGVSRIDRQRSGSRIFDINTDGTAHYGLLPDWIESLRVQAGPDGPALIGDLFSAAEAYTRMWERIEAYRG